MDSAETITIQANNVYNVPGSFKVFAVFAADAAFSIRYDDKGAKIPVSGAGYVDGDPTSKGHKKITFYNDSASAISVTYQVSSSNITVPVSASSAVTAVSAAVKDASTYTKGGNVTGLAAAGVITLNGLDGTKQRKQLVVSSDEATDGSGATFNILDANDHLFDRVKPGQTKTYISNGTFKIKNPNAGGVLLSYGETFYS